MAKMYFSKENFTCPKEQIMHKQLSSISLYTVLITNVFFFFGNNMKSAINSIANSVYSDQMASEEASWSGSALFSKQHASLK